MHKGFLTAACGLFLFEGIGAQALFTNVTSTHVPSVPDLHSLDTEFGDFDADGDLDIAIAVEGSDNRLYVNDGKGVFTRKTPAFRTAASDGEDLAVEDFDKDGDLDVIFVMEDGGTHQYYLGDGKGNFEDVSSRIPGCEGNGVEAADITGDGAMDVFIACSGSGSGAQDMLLINDGKGVFRNETSTRLPTLTESSQDIKVADLDGDGDLDLVVGNENQKNRLLLNDGAGKFVDAAANLPIPYQEETREVLLVDVDKDNDKDMVFCNLTCNACGTFTRNPQVRLLLNDGKAKFTDVTATHMPVNTFSSWDGGYLDFDADGDQDLLICAITVPGFTGQPVKAYRNDGAGKFSDITATAMPAGATGRLWDVEVADLDKNGTLDVFLGAWGTQAILLMGTVRQPTSIRRPFRSLERSGWRGWDPALPVLGSDGRLARVPAYGWKTGARLPTGRLVPLRQ